VCDESVCIASRLFQALTSKKLKDREQQSAILYNKFVAVRKTDIRFSVGTDNSKTHAGIIYGRQYSLGANIHAAGLVLGQLLGYSVG